MLYHVSSVMIILHISSDGYQLKSYSTGILVPIDYAFTIGSINYSNYYSSCLVCYLTLFPTE